MFEAYNRAVLELIIIIMIRIDLSRRNYFS